MNRVFEYWGNVLGDGMGEFTLQGRRAKRNSPIII